MTDVNIPIQGTIKKICGGARHTILLDESGCLYVAGKCEFTDNGYEGVFRKIETEHKFKDVFCGFDTTAAITHENRLFVWGNNSNNQLGVPKIKLIKEMMELTLPENDVPSTLNFGLKFLVIVTKSNKILITGLLKHFKNCENASHKIINHNSIDWLQLIPSNFTLNIHNLAHFTCGQNHISFVTNQHAVYSYGENKFGQCSQIESPEKIIKFQSGWTHNGFLTESKNLYLYGRNNYGQLGNGEKSTSGINNPQICPIYPVDDFALGAEHGILKSGRDVYTWGWNEHRNCGHDTEDDM